MGKIAELEFIAKERAKVVDVIHQKSNMPGWLKEWLKEIAARCSNEANEDLEQAKRGSPRIRTCRSCGKKSAPGPGTCLDLNGCRGR